MNYEKGTFRHFLLYEFLLGHTAAAAHRNLSVVFGDTIPCERQCAKWFLKFRKGEFSIEDEPHTGRPPELNDDDLVALLASNTRQSTRELASTLGCDHSTVVRHLAKLDFVQKLGQLVPHRLTQDQKLNRVTICSSLLSRRRTFDWLKQLVTGDEKWALYVNHTRKRQWLPRHATPEPDPKDELHPKKVLLSVFWDYRGIIWWELLPAGTTINAKVYSSQLQKLAEVHQQVRPERDKVVLLHDNARPHVAKLTKKKLKQLDWEVVPHAAYSPDLAPSDYHLFQALAHFLSDKSFDDFDGLKSGIETFFKSLSPEFFAKGIFELPERWSTVIDTDGDYITY